MISILRSGLVVCLACVTLSVSALDAPFTPSKTEMLELPMQTTSSMLDPQMYGKMRNMTSYSSTVSAVGTTSPFEETTQATSGPRRVSPSGGIGEPGAIEPTPVGDIPFWAVIVALGFYVAWEKKRQKKCE